MPGPKITAELLLTTDMKDAVREIDKGLSGAMRQHAKEVKKTVGRAWRDAIEVAMGEGKAGKAMKDFMKTGIVEAAETYQSLMKRERVVEAQAQKELLERRAKAFKREVDLRRQAFKEMQDKQLRTAEEAADEFGKGAQKFGNILRGDFGGLLDVARGGGRRLQVRGHAAQQRAANIQAAGGDPKQVQQMAKMGQQMAKIGASLATIAAVIGVVVLLVKLFADLESKIKDMNKALLESAGAADFGMSAAEIRAGGLRRELERLRDDTTGVNENFRKFRAGAKEQQRILSTLNQAGMTYARMNEEIKKGSKFMQSYSDATALAVVYSRNLGVESTQIAQTMGEFAFETGMSLEQVAESFSIIQREAMAAGFVTKRFYAAIVEATSGMNFYGVRIEETTKLLKSFDSLLGEAAGTEVFKKIAREGGKSFQETLQEFLIKEPEFVARQYETVFAQRLATLERQLQDTLPEGVTVRGLIEETGGGAALAARLEEMGITGQRGTDIMQVAELMKAATGDLTAMIGARGAAGPAFEAVMRLRQMPGLQAGESLGEIYETAIDEGNTGLLVHLDKLAKAQGKDFDELKIIDQKNLGRLQALQKIAKEGGEVPEHLQELGYFIERLPDGTAKVMKGIVDEAGAVNKDSAVEITDRFDMLLTEPTEDAKRLEEQMTRDQQIASEISRNITGLNDMMEQAVVAVLNDIYDVLIQIADFMFKDSPDRKRELRFQDDMIAKQKEAQKALKELTDEQDKLVAKQEQGHELSKQEQERLKELKGEIDQAWDEADIAQAVADVAKDVTADELREKGPKEVERGLRERFGDPEAAKPEVKKDTEESHERAQRVAPTGWESELPRALQVAGDVMEFMSPGGAFGTMTERVVAETGLAEHQARGRAKVGRFLGLEGYEGMTDAEIDALAEATQKGTERAYEGREVWRDIIGWGGVSARAVSQEARQDEVSKAFGEQAEAERELRETMETGMQELKGAVETSGMMNLLGGLFKPKKAGDLILPAEGGAPIITDERDTIMATRPGGPLEGAMGGKGTVQVNVYGGDQRKVYETVMRALKATGNA